MTLKDTLKKASTIYREYPRSFWILVAITFIDRIGGSLLFPFFALYLTHKFGVRMTDIGLLFAVTSLSSFSGSTVGGAVSDHVGRKGVIVFGLVASSLSAMIMGFVNSFQAFFGLTILAGLLAEVAGPAHQAMVADLLPEEKRADGYGILRVAFNLSVVFGPALGGLLASRSYLLLFLCDAVISLLAAGLVVALLPESKPQPRPEAPQETLAGRFVGYGLVFRDTAFMLFLGAVLLQVLCYMNMNTTLGVYLRNEHGTSEAGYGVLLSLNAAMVVLLQFPITRRVRRFAPMLMMALGTFLYAIGFSMYGFVTSYGLFMLAMVIITIGEMIVAPVAQALVAHFAPEELRGRYMAVAGFSWSIPFAIGPYLAGLILDHADPHWLWYAAGLVALLSTLGFLALHRVRDGQSRGRQTMAEAA